MVWNTARTRFFAALLLFLLWVGALAALAVVSAYRPAARSAPPGIPGSGQQDVQPDDGSGAKLDAELGPS
jgi:hypothetical protein